MANSFFKFKQFIVHQEHSAMKVTTDSCLFGAWVAYDLKKDSHSKKLLDIGAGTGLLSLMIAQQKKTLAIDAIEIEKEATVEATENIKRSPWKENINVIHGDVRDYEVQHEYDVIVSNPPFYENELQSVDQQKNTAHHSNNLTIDFLFRFIQSAIIKNGCFYILVPYKRIAEIEILLKQNELCLTEKVLVRQSINHNYFRVFIKGMLGNVHNERVSELSIKDSDQRYTKEFIELLKEYYLYL
ncbi:MAG: methyltransferase [Chitinophagaceae bacterium]